MVVVDQVTKYEFKGKTYEQQHGNPFDRGSADSWYSRPKNPHWYPEGTYKGQRVDAKDMTPAELEAYDAGYEYNEQFGGKKEWD
jgi:hypothetical protein